MRSVSGADGDAPVAPDASRDRSRHSLRSETQSSPSAESAARTREKKPPPPPKSHHGKRISHTAAANATASSDVDADAHSSQSTARSRSSNRLSIHDSSTERVTPGAAHPSSVSLPSAADYFSVSEDQVATESTDSLQRSHSQKRPPTPPLSRRHSQMRRSKSTQSKSSRLTMSSYDSEHESPTGSLPPSPGPPRSMASKRISMPPPSSSAEFQAAIPTGDVSVNPLGSPSSRPPSLKASRRASSYGSVPSNSSGPPPPPPPRRMRDSVIRSSDTPPTSRVVNDENTPLPQPSNALDILADLTKLQKEVDDLRGHYENRKVE